MAGLVASAVHPAAAVAQSSPIPFATQPEDPFVRYQPEGPDLPPPNLWDIATGEEISAGDVLKTKDFGVVVATVRLDASPAIRQVINAGDIILGMDGMRTYGKRELELARFRNPMSSTMTLLINREGDLQWIKLHDLAPGRQIGIKWNDEQEQDRFLNEIESLGLPIPDDRIIPALRLLPASAAAALDLWAHAKPSSALEDTAWLQDFISLYITVQSRRYADAAPTAHQPPIPYFQRLEKFYLSLAAANLPKEAPPDVARTGETPEYYTLALPVPFFRPQLGDLHFSDLRFNTLLTKVYAMQYRPDSDLVNARRESRWDGGGALQVDAEIQAAAAEYASSKGDGLARYLNEIKAGLLDAGDFDERAYTSDMVQQQVSRTLLSQQLDGLLKNQADPNWPLNAYAMIALDTLNGDRDDALKLIEALAQRSPSLAANAANRAVHHHMLRGGFRELRREMDKNGGFLPPDYPEVYRWATDAVGPLALACSEIAKPVDQDPYEILIVAPYAELSALKGVKAPPPTAAAIPAPDDTPVDGD